MSMCKLHSEFYRQQAKLDALLTRRCHTITEGKNGEGATYIKTARGWLHIADELLHQCAYQYGKGYFPYL